jgi:hypothetical protein
MTDDNYIEDKWIPPEYVIPENEQLRTHELLDLIQKLLQIVDERDVDIADVYDY